jgi:allantoin racemase
MRILWINPVGTDVFDADTRNILNVAKLEDTQVDVVSLPADRPKHLEYYAYEGLVVGDIVRLQGCQTASRQFQVFSSPICVYL